MSTDGWSNVFGVSSRGGEVVDVAVHDEVGVAGEERCPVGGALEAVLEHDWDAGVDVGNEFEDGVDVFDYPSGTGFGQACWRAEAREVRVRGFVDGCDGEGVLVAGGDDEDEDALDGLQGVGEVCAILEPVAVAESFADVKGVDATGERVQACSELSALLLNV